MKRYTFWNNLTGWIIFLIAAITYILTMEPTSSLWDCGEFISSAFKLQVGHPPGAPLFMIMARFFSLFAGGDLTKVAMMVNLMSALASAFTVLFLFWTISHLARKLLIKTEEVTPVQLLAIIGSSAVGSLAYTFSDSFWFSAVEAEVYASSSFFTAIVFWAILKWENIADEKHSNRWLILIAYLMGLSIGVHLLNLLTIPAIVLVYYFRKYNPTTKGFLYALLVSMVILAVMMYGVIPGVVKVASWFELLFVNGFGLPYNTGVFVYAILLIAAIFWGVRYTERHKKVIANTVILCFTVILIGYSSYAMIVIRALADPPMDENSPDNVFALLDYLNREQYGDRPLVFGHYYSDPIVSMKDGKPIYAQVDGKYKVIYRKPDYIYPDGLKGFFPRMWSTDPSHIKVYKEWGDIKGTPVKIINREGKEQTIVRPTFGENLRFFIKYQIGFMYGRYFMWNFSGRQNDIQGDGGIVNGNWITGIHFIDQFLLGSSEEPPKHILKHPSRNTYYLLPLLLGMIGLMFQIQKSKRDFVVVMMLFIMTGLAIVVYLNQTPIQPRERDYSYAGSFYAFAIWIGIGVAALWDLLGTEKGAKWKAVGISLLCLLLVPGIMAKENWTDHDRSGRYTARDLASNYLNSCPPNAILFTNGDNDTFPLWYAQEVEGIRTDVRVCNLMLLNMDWYIDQMKRKAYESDPLPISLKKSQYRYGDLNVVYLLDAYKEPIYVGDAVEFVLSDSPAKRQFINTTEDVDFIPGKIFFLPVDTALVVANGTVKAKDKKEMVSDILWKINKNNLGKSEFVVLDLFAHNQWKRPLCYAALGLEGSQGLEEYSQLNGFAYQLVPIRTTGRNFLTYGRIDTDLLYENMMVKFKWGRMNEPDIYLDHHTLRTLSVLKFRNNFNRLAEALLEEGKKDSAMKVLDRVTELAPNSKVPYDYFTIQTLQLYYALNAMEKANAMVKEYSDICIANLDYFLNLKPRLVPSAMIEIQENLQSLQNMVILVNQYKQQENFPGLEDSFNRAYLKYQSFAK